MSLTLIFLPFENPPPLSSSSLVSSSSDFFERIASTQMVGEPRIAVGVDA